MASPKPVVCIKKKKRQFHQTKISFLGYVFRAKELLMEVNKVNVVREWPTPKTVKELQRFFGVTNFYRRFIHNFSLIGAALASVLIILPIPFCPLLQTRLKEYQSWISVRTLLNTYRINQGREHSPPSPALWVQFCGTSTERLHSLKIFVCQNHVPQEKCMC